MLETFGDPLVAVRRFLYEIQHRANLEGIVVPLYQRDALGIKPGLVEDPSQLSSADPFAPLVATNGAKLVCQVARQRPEARFGAVLRSCEIRALAKLAREGSFQTSKWLIVGVDCLASFPAEDFDWRIQKVGNVQRLTRESLRFARQGGIAPYRYRQGCQMCSSPVSPEADLCLCLYGLPVREYLLVTAKNEAIAEKLHLDEITAGRAPLSLFEQHETMVATLSRRRMGVSQRAITNLPGNLPRDANSLVQLLARCAPCQKCLDACPIYAGELATIGNGSDALPEEVIHWLASCLECGMCEEACPNHLPLTAIKSRIARQLADRPEAA
jgi:formate dehydrogenase subunit beta